MNAVTPEKIEALLAPVVAGLGYELVDLSFQREAAGMVLRLFIDHPPASGNAVPTGNGVGIGLDDCSRVSHTVSAELDVADLIHVPFHLEVSSPGLDRPLKKEADFARFVGQKAKIRTRHPVGESRRNFSGRLLAVEAGKVKIDVGDQVCEVPVDDVEKANLVYEGRT